MRRPPPPNIGTHTAISTINTMRRMKNPIMSAFVPFVKERETEVCPHGEEGKPENMYIGIGTLIIIIILVLLLT